MVFGPTRKTLKRDLALAVVTATMTSAGGYAQTFPPENPPCPTSVLTTQQGSLAPAIVRPHCKTPSGTPVPNCLVSFKGYQWWTAYQYDPAHGFFHNDGLRTDFAPEHDFIDNDGNLHLVAFNNVNLGAGEVWSGAEAVLMFNGDGSEANLGYGDYLVTAKLVDHFWSGLDPNMALGVFTYENPNTGPNSNPNREIDLAEISRWGWNHTGTCPIGGFNFNFPNNTLCKGDAQFALQKTDNPYNPQDPNNGGPSPTQGPLMVDRYNIGDSTEVTLVMRWRERDVTFEKYTGVRSLNNLPVAPHDKWQDDLDWHPDTGRFQDRSTEGTAKRRPKKFHSRAHRKLVRKVPHKLLVRQLFSRSKSQSSPERPTRSDHYKLPVPAKFIRTSAAIDGRWNAQARLGPPSRCLRHLDGGAGTPRVDRGGRSGPPFGSAPDCGDPPYHRPPRRAFDT